ncbi:MAG TPA: hypothetical protein VGQ62_11210 [Chloroflexota bacterium]|jgi:hypothetical protein|nr:hypothetical protein [Chloroflexota bacterium]
MTDQPTPTPSAEDHMNINDTVILREIPVGARVRLRAGAIAEVTANPMDGAWVFIRYVEDPADPSKIGTEDMAFCTDVTGVLP